MQVQKRLIVRSLAATLVTGALMFLCGAPARAALIGVDWMTAGDQLLTLDSATGLEWLDLSQTANHSYNDLLSNYIGSGQALDGFQYATGAQVHGLFVDAGLTTAWSTREGGAFYTNALNLLGLVGATYQDTSSDRAYGMFGSLESGMMYLTGVEVWKDNTASIAPFNGFVGGGSWAWSPDLASPTAGSWLVRSASQAVPEPSTLLLLGSGLLGLVGLNRRRKA